MKTNTENRRSFLKRIRLAGGVGIAGTLSGSAAVNWLRTSGDAVNGKIIHLTPDPSITQFRPLENISITSTQDGTIVVLDGKNSETYRGSIHSSLSIPVGGALGYHLIIFLNGEGHLLDFATFKVDCSTSVEDSKGTYRELFGNLYHSMTGEWGREAGVVRYNGKHYHSFVDWLRDHVHTLKGMKYFYPELKSGIDLYADSQREDGMIWDNYNRRPEGGSYWQQRFDYADFIKVVDDGENEFHRIPVENDVEYLFIEGIYYTWKATGDDSWMKKMLDKALKAVEYSTTNPYRWSEKYRLLKRGYTIDTWDFQNDDDAAVSAGKDNYPDAMVIRLPYTRFGVMFGDNTGMYAGCLYLAEMLTHAGREEEAERIKKLGEGILTRLDTLAWNGRFYRHHIPEDASVKRDLGVDETKQVSLSNAYSINRRIGHDKAISIIKTYQQIRSEMPVSSPAEWYTIYPPFNKGYGDHNAKWSYMNGGVTTIVAGELAHGAFLHGYEAYGIDILNRILALSNKTRGYLHCTYRGEMPEIPLRNFMPVRLKDVANTDFNGNTIEGVAGWTSEGENDLHEFPVGLQVFHEIPFDIIDPAKNGRRACLGLSADKNYAREATLAVNQKAKSIYFLHTTGKNYYAGNVTLQYSDGSTWIDHMGPGKISNWWYPAESQDLKQTPDMRVAWTGRNKFSRVVGVCLYGLNNPYPDKEITSLHFQSSGDQNKWMILGITLCNHEVLLMPDFISTGIPDNWGAAAVVYALVEGLCGIKDEGAAFDKVLLTPRWSAAGEPNAKVTIKYPASCAYVSYQYSHSDNEMVLYFTGSMKNTTLQILLPSPADPKAVFVNEKSVDFQRIKVEESEYLVVSPVQSVVNKVVIKI